MEVLKIKKEIYEAMIEHCKACFPFEACGILAGENDFVTDIYKITNIEPTSVSFFMDPVEQLRAMKDIRQRNLQMLAIYHSHPYADAYPSQIDKELAFYDVFYVIVSIEPKQQVRCFKINNDQIKQQKLVVE